MGVAMGGLLPFLLYLPTMMPQTAVGPGWLFPIGPLGSSREQREQREADLGASCVIVIGRRPASKRRSRVCMAPSGSRAIQSPGSGAVRPRAVLSLAAVGAGPFARLCHHGICRSQQLWFLWCLRWWERRRGQMVCPNLAAAGTRRMSGRDGQATRLESRSAPKLWWTSAPNRCVVRTLQQICSFPDADHVGFGVSNRLQSVSGRSQLHQRLEMIDDFKFAHPPYRPETTRWSPSSRPEQTSNSAQQRSSSSVQPCPPQPPAFDFPHISIIFVSRIQSLLAAAACTVLIQC